MDEFSKNIDKNLNKIDVNKPLFLGNYPHHYIIILNRIDLLKKKKFPIHIENNEGLNGIMLAAKISNEISDFKILNFLLSTYPQYSLNKNTFNETFLDYLIISDQLIKLIEKNNIDWNYLFNHFIDNENFINKLFEEGSYKLINYFINNFKIEWDIFPIPISFNLINNKLSFDKKIKIFEKLKKQKDNILHLTDNTGKGIVFPIIKLPKKESLKWLNYIIENNYELDKFIPIYSFHPFILTYRMENSLNEGYERSKVIWNEIKENHDFSSFNKYGENLLFSVISYRIIDEKGCLEIEKDMINRNNYWNVYNINKVSVLMLLTELDFCYHNYLPKNLKVNKSMLKNITGKWKKYLSKLPKLVETNDIVLKKYPFVHTNIFSSTFLDASIFTIILDKKYKDLYIPKYKKDYNCNINFTYGFIFPDINLDKYNNFPYIIFWKDKNNYYIHPYLKELLNKNKSKYKIGFILISAILPNNGLHAMCLIIDFTNLTIERFDPYGNSHDLDPDLDVELDKYFDEYKFIYVKNYLPVSSFQSLADENNELMQKPGDFGGYCLAWCLWYLEHRIINLPLSGKELIPKLLKKLLLNNDNLFDYIRNYANDFNICRLKILMKIGIDKKRVSNINFNYDENQKIFNYIINKLTI